MTVPIIIVGWLRLSRKQKLVLDKCMVNNRNFKFFFGSFSGCLKFSVRSLLPICLKNQPFR